MYRDLDFNRIQTIEEGAFAQLVSLKELYASAISVSSTDGIPDDLNRLLNYNDICYDEMNPVELSGVLKRYWGLPDTAIIKCDTD